MTKRGVIPLPVGDEATRARLQAQAELDRGLHRAVWWLTWWPRIVVVVGVLGFAAGWLARGW